MKKEMPVNKDFEEFIALLNKHKVDYCVIGGYAVAFHAEPRFTQDIDVYVSRNVENAKRVAVALKEFAGNNPVDDVYFAKENSFARMGEAPNKIEVLNFLEGLEGESFITRRVMGKYGREPIYYIGLDDLIASKLAVKDKESRKAKKGIDESDISMLEMAQKRKKK